MTNVARKTIFLGLIPEQYIDQGGPCGHSDPHTGADDCLCQDGWYTPAGIEVGYSAGYCDRDHTYDNYPF
jgi:hypothetical protein